MKKFLSVVLALAMFLSLAAVTVASAEDITLDVIICEYGNNTRNWFLGEGMDGSNFVALNSRRITCSCRSPTTAPKTCIRTSSPLS